jgi:putative membrane protein
MAGLQYKHNLINMKKLAFLLSISVATFAFQGCNSGTKDAKETADSLNTVKDTATDVVATGGIAVEESDVEFATKAAVGGMAEVQFGNLAIQKTTNTQIKDFANMMVKDHGKANDELMAIATTKNITLPTMLDDEHQKKMSELSGRSGNDFDKTYVDAMVDGHKKTLKLMQDEAKDGKDADLRAFAAKTAPIVQSHLNMITKIHDGMK